MRRKYKKNKLSNVLRLMFIVFILLTLFSLFFNEIKDYSNNILNNVSISTEVEFLKFGGV